MTILFFLLFIILFWRGQRTTEYKYTRVITQYRVYIYIARREIGRPRAPNGEKGKGALAKMF